MATAKKATLSDAKLKILIWGDPGAGKSRFALSAPNPLVIDTEQSTALYANEFDFLLAEVDKSDSKTASFCNLVKQILKEFNAGEYPDVKTLVIDNLSDVLDNLESSLILQYETKLLGKKLTDLNKLELSKWYSFRKTQTRKFLDDIKANKTHVIMIGRSKLEWGKGVGGTQPTGNTLFDGLEIVESLADIVIHLKKEKRGDVRALVKKSRLADLPDELPVRDFSSIEKAIKGILEESDDQESDENINEINI